MLKGALAGAIGGMFGVGFNPARIIAGGAIGALVTGGDPMMGAMTAGISAGVGACFEISPLAGVFGDVKNNFFAALRFSTASGALAGGVTAEIFGGDFGDGALYGAMGATAGYVVGSLVQGFSAERGQWTKGMLASGTGDSWWVGDAEGNIRGPLNGCLKVDMKQIDGIPFASVNGYIYLDDRTLNMVMRPYIQQVNKWFWWNPINLIHLQTLDSGFFDERSVKGFVYQGRVFSGVEVNYLLQGHAYAKMRLGPTDAGFLVYAHNKFWHHKLPSEGKSFWAGKGYKEYDSREDW